MARLKMPPQIVDGVALVVGALAGESKRCWKCSCLQVFCVSKAGMKPLRCVDGVELHSGVLGCESVHGWDVFLVAVFFRNCSPHKKRT